jgi:hypothetical protein
VQPILPIWPNLIDRSDRLAQPVGPICSMSLAEQSSDFAKLSSKSRGFNCDLQMLLGIVNLFEAPLTLTKSYHSSSWVFLHILAFSWIDMLEPNQHLCTLQIYGVDWSTCIFQWNTLQSLVAWEQCDITALNQSQNLDISSAHKYFTSKTRVMWLLRQVRVAQHSTQGLGCHQGVGALKSQPRTRIRGLDV